MTRGATILAGILEQIFPGVGFGEKHRTKPQPKDEIRPKRIGRAPGWSGQRRAVRGMSNRGD